MGNQCTTDVVESLLRLAYRTEACQKYEASELSAAEFKQLEDRAVNKVIKLQEDTGLEVITEGEQCRYAFFGHLIEAMEGFDKFGWSIPFRDEQGNKNIVRRPIAVEKLHWKRNMCAEEFTYLRTRTNRVGKVTLISTMPDIVDITRREIEELIRLGCTRI